jgi:CelD/BcsL family acetyltransferase involved in cellulose biosynthesis
MASWEARGEGPRISGRHERRRARVLGAGRKHGGGMNDIQSEMTLRAELPAIPALLTDPASPAAVRPALHPRRGTAFDVDVASTPRDLDALAGDWAALEALCDARTVFQSYAAIRIWVRHFISRGRERLHVAVVREGGRPVLILPLVITGRPGMRIAHLAGDPISQYSDILVDPAADGPAAFAAALDSVRAAGADAIVLRRVRADSSLYALAQEHLRPP